MIPFSRPAVKRLLTRKTNISQIPRRAAARRQLFSVRAEARTGTPRTAKAAEKLPPKTAGAYKTASVPAVMSAGTVLAHIEAV